MLDYKLKTFLDEAVVRYEHPSFIENDPISIPHKFKKKEDIEIAGFLTSIISWGRREAILKSANLLMDILENEPYSFIMQASKQEMESLKKFYYRTLNGQDIFDIVISLKLVYNIGGIENFFKMEYSGEPLIKRIARFYGFMRSCVSDRTKRHLSSMDIGSAGKRANMFLRWMVRSAERGVDFGIWKNVVPSELFLPLDVHAGNVARKLALTKRKSNDKKTVEEITSVLCEMCPEDPIKYDFALFATDL